MEKNVELWKVLLGVSFRYFIFAGLAYLIFYIWKKRSFLPYKIQQRFPKPKAIQTELKYSIITIFIFAVVVYLTFFTPLRQYTKIYTNIHDYSLAYFFISIFLVILFHDTYFYWTHRLMHHKKIFPYVHHIHHKSHNPTPLAAFSFHPLEAIVEVGVVPLMVMTMPVHRFVFVFFGLYMIVMNVIGHLGFEFFPKHFVRHKFFRFLNTSTHHNMHHHYSKANFGLYFNFWDRIMKTNHARYEEEFEQVTANAEKSTIQSQKANLITK